MRWRKDWVPPDGLRKATHLEQTNDWSRFARCRAALPLSVWPVADAGQHLAVDSHRLIHDALAATTAKEDTTWLAPIISEHCLYWHQQTVFDFIADHANWTYATTDCQGIIRIIYGRKIPPKIRSLIIDVT